MRTEVDICNNALSEIGHDRMIETLSESSAEAAKCALQLPFVRQSVFCSRSWKWMRSEPLEPLEYPGAAVLPGYSSVWHLPADRLGVGRVADAAGEPMQWEVRGNALHTRGVPALIETTRDIEDPAQWPEYIAQAVSAALAHKLAALLSKSGDVLRMTRESAAIALAEAKRRDAVNHQSQPGVKNPYASARGVVYGQD